MSTLGERIAAEARTWENTRFVHAGRSEQGLDCIGLLAVVAHSLGLTNYDDRNYSRQEAAGRIRGEIERFCEQVEGEPQAGDVLFLSVHGIPTHCGISLGDGQFIHAFEQDGKVVTSRLDRFWRARLVAVFRWRGEGVEDA